MKPTPHIHFYSRRRFKSWPDLDRLTRDDIPRLQSRFRMGVDVWIVQTFLLMAPALREAGFQVSAGADIPAGCMLIAHRDDLNALFDGLHRSFIVAVRTDRAPARVAHAEILQNGLQVGQNEYFVPSWPQPGLIPRDESRGNDLQRIAYFGRQDSLPPWFFSADFLGRLADRKVEFEVRHKVWNDYHDIDLVLAHRLEAPTMLQQKPGTKLCNAWLAGVPALLSPEPEYRRLRESPDDFMEILSADDVIAAIDTLQATPARYAAMRERCRMRAQAFGEDAVATRWLEVLTGPLADQYDHWLLSGSRSWFSYAGKLARQKSLSRAFKNNIATELKRMNAPAPLRSVEPESPGQKR